MGKALVIIGADFSRNALDTVSLTYDAPSGGGGTDTPTYYYITYNLTGYSSSNSATMVQQGSSFSATLSLLNGYTAGTIAVTMGGQNVSVSNGIINIPSVTGNIVISAVAQPASGGEDTPPATQTTLERVGVAANKKFLDTDDSPNTVVSGTSTANTFCYTNPINVSSAYFVKLNHVAPYVFIAYSTTEAIVNTTSGVLDYYSKTRAINYSEMGDVSANSFGIFALPDGAKSIRVNVPLSGSADWDFELITSNEISLKQDNGLTLPDIGYYINAEGVKTGTGVLSNTTFGVTSFVRVQNIKKFRTNWDLSLVAAYYDKSGNFLGMITSQYSTVAPNEREFDIPNDAKLIKFNVPRQGMKGYVSSGNPEWQVTLIK